VPAVVKGKMTFLAIADVQELVGITFDDHFEERHLFKMLSLDLELQFTVTFLPQVLFVKKVYFWSDSHNDVVVCKQREEERFLLSCNLEGGFLATFAENIALKEYEVYFARLTRSFQFFSLFLDFDRFFGRLTFILCFFLISVLVGGFFWLWPVNYNHC
jgi:hypothetical protein